MLLLLFNKWLKFLPLYMTYTQSGMVGLKMELDK